MLPGGRDRRVMAQEKRLVMNTGKPTRTPRLSDKPITLFPWEQKEYARHHEEMHREKAMADFLRASIVSLAKRVNEADASIAGPELASCLLDMVDDCDKQIGAVKPNARGRDEGCDSCRWGGVPTARRETCRGCKPPQWDGWEATQPEENLTRASGCGSLFP